MSKTGKFTAILLLGGPGQCLAAAPQSETLGAKTPQSITVVSDDDYPPYIFRNSEKELQGILVDMWKAWEKQTQIKVNLLAMSWVKAQAFFQEGKADVIDTMFFNEERLKTYEFGRPYATIDVSVFYHKSLGGLSNLDSLQGFAVGVKSGDSCIKLLKNSF